MQVLRPELWGALEAMEAIIQDDNLNAFTELATNEVEPCGLRDSRPVAVVVVVA